MSGNRSPSFGLLRNVLPSVPARSANEDSKAEPIPLEHTSPEMPTVDARAAEHASEPALYRNTAAVQQLIETPSEQRHVRSTLVARPGKNKAITRPSTFRLAIELQDALKTVADYNGLNMTDIVAESIWQHLQDFEWPSGSDDLRKKVSQLF
jgi:hypothetical protein